jgi:hypothetical protein
VYFAYILLCLNSHSVIDFANLLHDVESLLGNADSH